MISQRGIHLTSTKRRHDFTSSFKKLKLSCFSSDKAAAPPSASI